MNAPYHILFGVAITLSSIPLSAQDWAPIGAVWHYRTYIQGFPPLSSSIRYEVVADTVINGQATRKVTAGHEVTTFYTHDVEGLVLAYVPMASSFDTLFNFNALPGERWSMVPLPDPLACTTESWVEVVDTGSTMIDAVPLRWLAVNYHNITDDQEFVGTDTIVERLGSKSQFMLPQELCNTLVSPGSTFDLLCYSDNTIAYVQPAIVHCNPGSAIPSNATHSALELVPNPGSDGFTLKANEASQAMITVPDARGALVFTTTFNSVVVGVATTAWPNGLYTVRYTPTNSPPVSARWVKL